MVSALFSIDPMASLRKLPTARNVPATRRRSAAGYLAAALLRAAGSCAAETSGATRSRPLIAAEWACSVGRSLSWHLREFLTAFGYVSPALRTVAIDVHFRIEPACVIEGASFDKRESRHSGDIREDRRSAFRTKVPLNRLTTVASVVECLNSSLN